MAVQPAQPFQILGKLTQEVQIVAEPALKVLALYLGDADHETQLVVQFWPYDSDGRFNQAWRVQGVGGDGMPTEETNEHRLHDWHDCKDDPILADAGGAMWDLIITSMHPDPGSVAEQWIDSLKIEPGSRLIDVGAALLQDYYTRYAMWQGRLAAL